MQKIKTKSIKIFLSGLIFVLVFINTSIAQAAFSAGTLVSMTNSVRTREGLGSLSNNSQLASAAYAKAQDMFANQYFAHTSPDGKTPWDFIRGAGYSYTFAGENLAIGYTDAGSLFADWMASSTHRANILNSNFREIGIAVVSGTYEGAETIIAVQEFGAQEGSSEGEVAGREEEATPTPEAQNQTPSSNSEPQNQAKQFQINREKSNFNPRSIFAGEEVNYSVTISGEVTTLEAQVFDQKINLLETAAVIGSTQEKTYTMSQKIETVGTSDVNVIVKDKAGNEEHLNLGKLEVKPETLSNTNNRSDQNGLFAGFRNVVKDHWVYFIILGGVLIAFGGYLIFRKYKFSKFSRFALFSWEL